MWFRWQLKIKCNDSNSIRKCLLLFFLTRPSAFDGPFNLSQFLYAQPISIRVEAVWPRSTRALTPISCWPSCPKHKHLVCILSLRLGVCLARSLAQPWRTESLAFCSSSPLNFNSVKESFACLRSRDKRETVSKKKHHCHLIPENLCCQSPN